MTQWCALLALCLAISAATEARVLKSKQISMPAGAMVMDLAIREKTDNSGGGNPIATMKIEIDGEHRKMTLYDSAGQTPPRKVLEVTMDKDSVPKVDSRFGIRVKNGCPIGYVRRAGVCFPDD